jgi:cytochrome c-type biogenesis protein
MLEAIAPTFYELDQWSDTLVSQQLQHVTLLSMGIVLGAGLLTSLTPCVLSMLPITLGYLGGYETGSRRDALLRSVCFSLGLATTLTGLGLVAALLGRVYGQIGSGLALAVSLIAIVMGLSLLELFPIRLPAFRGGEALPSAWPQGLRAYLLGLSFGLVASPCSTPVLATLLAWVAQSEDPGVGAVLLLCYALGSVTPLFMAGLFVAALKRLLSLRRWSGWITPTSGIILVLFGVVTLLNRFPLVGVTL